MERISLQLIVKLQFSANPDKKQSTKQRIADPLDTDLSRIKDRNNCSQTTTKNDRHIIRVALKSAHKKIFYVFILLQSNK